MARLHVAIRGRYKSLTGSDRARTIETHNLLIPVLFNFLQRSARLTTIYGITIYHPIFIKYDPPTSSPSFLPTRIFLSSQQ